MPSMNGCEYTSSGTFLGINGAALLYQLAKREDVGI